jgi:hypothetical protein
MAPGDHDPPETGAPAGVVGLSAGRLTSDFQHDDVVEPALLLRRVIGALARDGQVVEDLV